MNVLTPAQAAWVAGIIEGEGYINADRGHSAIVVGMTDFDVIRRLWKWTGIGRLREAKPARENYKPKMVWQVARVLDIRDLLMVVRPLLGERRGAKADELLVALVERCRPGSLLSMADRQQHGTNWMYQRQGCRCAECRAGAAKRQRAWVATKRRTA